MDRERARKEELLDQAMRLRDVVTERATTGSPFAGGAAAHRQLDLEYRQVRRLLMKHTDARARLPDFVSRFSDLQGVWDWIQPKSLPWKERRGLIREGFQPLISYLESAGDFSDDAAISETLEKIDSESVRNAWQKALARRMTDPEGAITVSKSLIEDVCKHILDDFGADYGGHESLPKLWTMVAERLNLAPGQHQEGVFKAILGNCQAVVGNLAAVRNRLGDAHGHGPRPARPQARHAELAVNLAGAMAAFLVATWEHRRASK